MRKILILLSFLFPSILLAQEYSEVVEVPGRTAPQLYSSAREWFAETFKSANNVLQMDDPVAGKLIGKGSSHVSESYVAGGMIKVPMKIDWYLNFTIKVFVKDEKYKCDIIDIIVKTPGANVGVVDLPETEVPFSNHLIQKEFYKDASDPEWLYNNPTQEMKISKSAAKSSAPVFSAMYNLTIKTEEDMKSIIASLQEKMKSIDDNW